MFSALVLAPLGASRLPHRRPRLSLPFSLRMFAGMLWVLLSSLEMLVEDPGTKILLTKLHFVGLAPPLDPLWFTLARKLHPWKLHAQPLVSLVSLQGT